MGYAYHELVDYLMLQYLVGYGQIAPPNLPQVGAPVVPDVPQAVCWMTPSSIS